MYVSFWLLMRCVMVQCMFSERRLQSSEFPHNLYMQNYSTASATCVCLRKWLFSLKCEKTLYQDEQTLTFLYHQVPTIVNDLFESNLKLKCV